MSHWNHRVVRRIYLHEGRESEVLYGIHETYYGMPDEDDLNKDDPKPAFTTDAIDVVGESVEELRETLYRMLKALDKPVLDYETREELPADNSVQDKGSTNLES